MPRARVRVLRTTRNADGWAPRCSRYLPIIMIHFRVLLNGNRSPYVHRMFQPRSKITYCQPISASITINGLARSSSGPPVCAHCFLIAHMRAVCAERRRTMRTSCVAAARHFRHFHVASVPRACVAHSPCRQDNAKRMAPVHSFGQTGYSMRARVAVRNRTETRTHTRTTHKKTQHSPVACGRPPQGRMIAVAQRDKDFRCVVCVVLRAI